MRGVPTGNAERERTFAAILFELVHRRTPTLNELGYLTGLRAQDVEQITSDLARIGAIVVDRDGSLLAAYPLSAVPTAHSVELGFASPWANCAIDALAVPAMVSQRGTIRSACRHCGAPVAIEVEGTSILRADPAQAVVVYGSRADCCERPSLEASCPYINFFSNIKHAREWQPPESWQGRALSFNGAAALAVDRFRPIIEIYARHKFTAPAAAV